MSEIEQSMKKVYKTKELNVLQKLMQMYWMIPKSWLLDEFVYEEGIVTIKLKNGKVLSAPLAEIQMKKQKDSYDRQEMYLSHHGNKIHFKEIPYMLTDEEWEELLNILECAGQVKQTVLGTIVKVANEIKEIID